MSMTKESNADTVYTQKENNIEDQHSMEYTLERTVTDCVSCTGIQSTGAPVNDLLLLRRRIRFIVANK